VRNLPQIRIFHGSQITGRVADACRKSACGRNVRAAPRAAALGQAVPGRAGRHIQRRRRRAQGKIDTSAAYQRRRNDAEFNRQWQIALCEGYDNLEMELLHRLRTGEVKPPPARNGRRVRSTTPPRSACWPPTAKARRASAPSATR
jgi:outer membrane receptor for monomeric catechols